MIKNLFSDPYKLAGVNLIVFMILAYEGFLLLGVFWLVASAFIHFKQNFPPAFEEYLSSNRHWESDATKKVQKISGDGLVLIFIPVFALNLLMLYFPYDQQLHSMQDVVDLNGWYLNFITSHIPVILEHSEAAGLHNPIRGQVYLLIYTINYTAAFCVLPFAFYNSYWQMKINEVMDYSGHVPFQERKKAFWSLFTLAVLPLLSIAMIYLHGFSILTAVGFEERSNPVFHYDVSTDNRLVIFLMIMKPSVVFFPPPLKKRLREVT